MNSIDAEIIIVGAGAAGLMAARTLARGGKKVMVLEARDRIGGRIWPLAESEFGYPAQGGAEFVHGPAPVTKSLLAEAGLAYEPMRPDGEMWSVQNGRLIKSGPDPLDNPELMKNRELLKNKLFGLKNDLPIAEFLDQNFPREKFASLRDWISGMVEGFDAADSREISTFSLRDEWLGKDEWVQGRIREGYTLLIDYLYTDCKKHGVSFILNQQVKSVDVEKIILTTRETNSYIAQKAIITVPIPIISQIEFIPPLPEKISAAADIGFGQVIKLLLRFGDRWWIGGGMDLSKMVFLLADEPVGAWWTQYPHRSPVLTGWIAGPKAEKFKNMSQEEILDLGLESLARIFKADKEQLKHRLLAYKVANWPADPWALGAYSYSKIKSPNAYAELRKSVNNKLFFAGEAVYDAQETATVEGALASGREVAEKILLSL